VGYSLGGYVALVVARRRQAGLTSLVLLGSAGRVSAYGVANFVARLVRARMSHSAGLAGQLRADLGWVLPSRRALRALDSAMPVLAVAFERDRLHRPSLIAKGAKDSPAARYVEIEGCGHDAPFAEPERVFSVVVDFLTRIQR
jgi:pimeloyl-ACP methyl ester carboxylesterase